MSDVSTCVALVVEDELFISLELEDILRELGYLDVAAFTDLAMAFSWLETGRPEVAVVDYYLKGISTEKLIVALMTAGVPTVIYSGRSYDPSLDGDTLSTCEWLTKPADGVMLADAIVRASAVIRLGAQHRCTTFANGGTLDGADGLA